MCVTHVRDGAQACGERAQGLAGVGIIITFAQADRQRYRYPAGVPRVGDRTGKCLVRVKVPFPRAPGSPAGGLPSTGRLTEPHVHP